MRLQTKCKECYWTTKIVLYKDGSKHKRKECKKCGRYAPWEGFDQPLLSAGIVGFQMPFGKYTGKTLDDIAEEDPDYIVWAADTFADGEIKDKCAELVKAWNL